MQNKRRILAWGDGVSKTGFGIVAHHVLSALHRSNKYEIEQIAINYHGDFINKEEWPWQLTPAKLANPDDPYGTGMFLKALAERDYDYVWILNDTFVIQKALFHMKKVFDLRKERKLKVPKVVMYYPVDCTVIPGASDVIEFADVPVCYNDYGEAETLKVYPNVKSKLRKIEHGVDTDAYRPLSKEQVSLLKKNFLKIDPSTYLIINVNRNSPRKQIPKLVWAFKEFRKRVPNSLLYLHTNMYDQSPNNRIDLLAAIKSLGMDLKNDVVFPVNYSPSEPFSEEDLNKIYNAADLFVSTHLGEGHGLGQVEAMSAGTPIVIPDNTNARELVGEDQSRGYLYPCKEVQWIDNSGFRKDGQMEDIVEAMVRAYRSSDKFNNKKVQAAREWCLQHTWGKVCQEWIKLFEELDSQPEVQDEFLDVGEVL